jgi:Fur family iron response transcriptional regulator
MGTRKGPDDELMARIEACGIRVSAQRLAVAKVVLAAEDHPSADRVWERVCADFPMISRATVYNTLNLFVAHGLLRRLDLASDSTVFDPKVDRHHHLVDSKTGRIRDVPWDAIKVGKIEIAGFEVEDFQVVVRGKWKRRAR